jgi:hypothetical protein
LESNGNPGSVATVPVLREEFMCSLRLYRKRHIAIAIKITTPTTIPMIAPVCKPLLRERVDAEGEGVLVWCEVLIVNGADVVVKANMAVVGGEELVVVAISKNNIISKNNSKWD